MNTLEAVRTIMSRYESLEIGGIRDAQLERRISSFMRRSAIGDEAELLAGLRRDPALRARMIDALTINVTSVYRNASAWDLLRKEFLPGMGHRVKMWSAGASTGAEAYSMAIVAKENGQTADITATDIDQRSLDKAVLGRYSKQELNEVPTDIRAKYFTEDDDEWVVDPTLRRSIRFAKHDLLAEPAVGSRFDLIACRNVVIYFSAAAQRDLHRKLAAALRPGGVLFIGGAERVAEPEALGLETKQRPFYVRREDIKAVAV
ncbi:MAG: protein-glutamate O-methyltransferase CheR [Acidimicrobiia bacterium]